MSCPFSTSHLLYTPGSVQYPSESVCSRNTYKYIADVCSHVRLSLLISPFVHTDPPGPRVLRSPWFACSQTSFSPRVSASTLSAPGVSNVHFGIPFLSVHGSFIAFTF